MTFLTSPPLRERDGTEESVDRCPPARVCGADKFNLDGVMQSCIVSLSGFSGGLGSANVWASNVFNAEHFSSSNPKVGERERERTGISFPDISATF